MEDVFFRRMRYQYPCPSKEFVSYGVSAGLSKFSGHGVHLRVQDSAYGVPRHGAASEKIGCAQMFEDVFRSMGYRRMAHRRGDGIRRMEYQGTVQHQRKWAVPRCLKLSFGLWGTGT